MLFYDKLNSHLKGTKLGINYYKPGEIPDAKANNIRKKAGINKDEQLLALIDMSLMKSGKAGIAFTDKGIHIKTMLSHARFVSYEDLAVSEVYALDNTLNINNSNMQYSSTSLPDDVNTKQLIQLIKNIKLSKMKSEGIRLRKPPIEIKKIAGLALRSILYFLIILLVFDFFSTTEKTFKLIIRK